MCKLYNTTTEKKQRSKKNVCCLEYDDTKFKALKNDYQACMVSEIFLEEKTQYLGNLEV